MNRPFLSFLIALTLIIMPLANGYATDAVGSQGTPPSQQKLKDVIREGIISCTTADSLENRALFRSCLKEKIIAFVKERALAKKTARMTIIGEATVSLIPAPSETSAAASASDGDPFLGEANAPVTVVEFTDMECPYCRSHFNQVFPQINEKYIKTGKVKYVLRDFPLSFHQNSMYAAIAANCVLEQAGNEKYFAFHDGILSDWSALGEELYKKVAKELDLNVNWFTDCLDKADESEINKDMEDAKALGLTGVPFFLIGDQRITGSLPFEAFQLTIEAELLKTGK